ncbi:hypothetical protein MKW94_010527, partial [Papaver nudicaule]|nr:hypothetical protein [Papaver nudicaule]
MKTILSSETMDIPDGVKIKVKAKMIKVEGPRGKLIRNFKHLNLDFQLIKNAETGKKQLKVDAWFGSRKTSASTRDALSHVDNLITGVTKGGQLTIWDSSKLDMIDERIGFNSISIVFKFKDSGFSFIHTNA